MKRLNEPISLLHALMLFGALTLLSAIADGLDVPDRWMGRVVIVTPLFLVGVIGTLAIGAGLLVWWLLTIGSEPDDVPPADRSEQ